MTTPTEAYIGVLAQDAYRAIRGRAADDPSTVACGRHGRYLVIVARGDAADMLEKAFEEADG